MLDFANRPPQSPEDVRISESGRTLLESAIELKAQWALTAYGRVAITEVVDAFGGEISPGQFEAYSSALVQEARSLYGYEAANFGSGMDSGQYILEQSKVEVEA